MLNIILVLILSPNIALCKLVVTPDLLVPIKQYNEACGYDACPVPLLEDGIVVHIVPHTHYELAFQRTFSEHYVGKNRFGEFYRFDVNMKRTLDGVITELWTQTHRRFTLSDMPYFFHWWSQRDENVRQMVYTLIRQGRLTFVGGGWSMNDEATTNYHAIIDSFTYSLRKINATFWECGRPRVAWQADVFGHSKEFASLAAQMGYDALFINPISFDDELARMRRWALEMLWRGSDDLGPQSDIFTHKLFDGYWAPPGFCFSTLCTDPLMVTSDVVMNNIEERVKVFLDSMYYRQAPNYNSSHVMVIMGMMLGYHDAPYWFANIDALIKSVNARAGRGKQKMYLMYSNPACYAKAVRDSGMPLETKQDDFFPVAYDKHSYLTGLYTTSPSIKLMAKEIMVYLQMCKQMRVFAEIGPHHNGLFEELNWVMGVFQDHTIITGYSKDEVKSYYREKMYLAMQRSTLLLKEAWNKLRKCPETTLYYRCSFNVSRCHHIIGDNYFVQIQNVLAWHVTMPVRLPIQYFGEEFRVYDPKGDLVKSTVIKIPDSVLRIHSRVNTSNYEVVFIAKNLPPLGFRSYFIQRVTARNRNKREDTGSIRADPPTNNEKDDPKRGIEKNDSRTIVERDDPKPKVEGDIPQTTNKIDEFKTKIKEADPQTRNDKIDPKTSNDRDVSRPKSENEDSGKKSENEDTQMRNKRDETDARPHMPIIKNMNRKANKKYLIRQTNPQLDDKSLLYDLDEGDDDVSTTEKGNVTVLLESDFDEIRMQHLSDDEVVDRTEDVEETVVPADLEQQTTPDSQMKTKTEQHETNVEQLSTQKYQSSSNEDKYTTTILRKPVLTSSQLLEQTTDETRSRNNKAKNLNNVISKQMIVTNNTVKPRYWSNQALKDSDNINNTDKPRHWNKVASKDLDITDGMNEPRHWKKLALQDSNIINNTLKLQHWSKQALKDSNIANDTVKVLHWNKEASKDLDIINNTDQLRSSKKVAVITNDTNKPRHWNKALNDNRRVNKIFDFLGFDGVTPNRTPSPQLILTPTPMHSAAFNESTTNNIVREDASITVPNADIIKHNNKVEEVITVTDQEIHHNKGEILPEPTDSEIVDTMPVKESNLDKEKHPEKSGIFPEEITEGEFVVDTALLKESELDAVKDATKVEVPSMDVAAEGVNEGYRMFPEKMDVATKGGNEEYRMSPEKSGTTQEPKKIEEDATDVNLEELGLITVNNTYIENKYIRIIIDPATSKITSVTLSNGLRIDLDIQFYYYVSDDPVALGKVDMKRPGSVVFRAMENTAIPVLDFINVQVFKSDVVEEAHVIYSTWISFVIRLYEESPVVEVEWLVGPVPVEDKLGKEVFVRYLTNLVHEGVFYTDSNGRQTIKRIRHLRPMYESMNLDPIAGNLYPVTSKISIEDLNSDVRFSVFVDRAQGGTSLADGEVDLMLSRRILTDDSGTETFANDTEYGQGAVVRGKHHLYISKANHKPYNIFEKKFAKELQLAPQVLVSRPDPYRDQSKQIWFNSINEVSFLKTKLPIGIHLLTLEDWSGDTFLLRLENYLEKNDTMRGLIRTVFIQEMFTNIYITHVKETTLAANMWLKDRQREKFIWPKKENFVRSFNGFYGVDKEVEFLTEEEAPDLEPVVNFENGIKLAPQQIRTFVCNFDYIEM